MVIDYTGRQLNSIQRAILASYPEWDIDRHYWIEGDVVEFSRDCIALCIESKGFTHDIFMVISGALKGTAMDVPIERTPYLAKNDYSVDSMLELAKKYCIPRSRLLYTKGDIVQTDNGLLVCITEIKDNKGYNAFVIADEGNGFYRNSYIYLPNEYSDYTRR